MTIQEQVPDLSICQEAKDRGVEIESNFKWYKFSLSKSPTLQLDPNGNFATLSGNLEWSCSAPLTDEILEKLPVEIEKDGQVFRLTIWINKNDYAVFYGGENFCLIEEKDKKLSNALIRLAIKLKEEEIIK